MLEFRNPWWRAGEPIDFGLRRSELAEIVSVVDRERVVALCGLRRAGKTTLLRQVVEQQLARGRPPTEILFIDFEEHGWRRERTDPTFPERLFKAYRDRFAPKGVPLLLLDEVQDLPDWGPWVRTLVETGQATCVITGSSSQIIEPALATVLTGRHLTIDVEPLCFSDALDFTDRTFGQRGRSDLDLRTACDAYLKFGALPMVVLEPSVDAKERRLSALFDQLLLNDIVARHRLRATDAVRTLALHCLEQSGNLIAQKRLRDMFDLSMDQVRDWLEYFADARLVHRVPLLDDHASVVEKAPRKVYAGDLGLRFAATLQFTPDLGRLHETAVYLHLRRCTGAEIRYWSTKEGECDFILWRRGRAAAAIQVCREVEVLPYRELRGLLAAMKRWGLTSGTIVTRSVESVEEVDGFTVTCVPLHRWLQRAPSELLANPDE